MIGWTPAAELAASIRAPFGGLAAWKWRFLSLGKFPISQRSNSAKASLSAYSLGKTGKSRLVSSRRDFANYALHNCGRAQGESCGIGVSKGAATVGSGVASAAATVARPFRSVDVDGDGIPDEPQALAAVKGLSGAIAGAADVAGGRVAGLFKSKRRGRDAVAELPADNEDPVEN